MSRWLTLPVGMAIVLAGLALIVINLVGLFVAREIGIAVYILWLALTSWLFWRAWQAHGSEIGLRQSVIVGFIVWLSWGSFPLFLEKIEVIKRESLEWWLLGGPSLIGWVYMIWAYWKLARLREAQRSLSSHARKDHGQVP